MVKENILDRIKKEKTKGDSIEERFIGSLIAVSDAIYDVYESHPSFGENVFVDSRMKELFGFLHKMASSGESITVLSVHKSSGFEEKEIRGLLDKHNKHGESPTTYADTIMDRYVRRRASEISQDIINVTTDFSENPFDSISALLSDFDSILDGGASRSYEKTMEQATTEMVNEVQAIMKRRAKGGDIVVGIPTRLKDLDDHMSGWRNTDLVIIAGRPGSGKTSFALTCAMNAALSGYPVGIITAEMAAKQMSKRMISMHSNINGHSIRDGKLDPLEVSLFNESVEIVGKLPIFFNEKGGIKLNEIVRTSRKWKRRNDIKMLVIDYIQLARVDSKKNNNRHHDIGEISRTSKRIAKDLQIPVLALSQLSRAVETRGGSKRPILSDLRESGSIEEDADIVMFMYRPEYYGIMEDEKGESLEGVAEAIIAKFRDGSPDTIKLGFKKETTLFHDLNYHSKKPGFWPTEEPPQNVRVPRPKMNDDEDIPF